MAHLSAQRLSKVLFDGAWQTIRTAITDRNVCVCGELEASDRMDTAAAYRIDHKTGSPGAGAVSPLSSAVGTMSLRRIHANRCIDHRLAQAAGELEIEQHARERDDPEIGQRQR